MFESCGGDWESLRASAMVAGNDSVRLRRAVGARAETLNQKIIGARVKLGAPDP